MLKEKENKGMGDKIGSEKAVKYEENKYWIDYSEKKKYWNWEERGGCFNKREIKFHRDGLGFALIK